MVRKEGRWRDRRAEKLSIRGCMGSWEREVIWGQEGEKLKGATGAGRNFTISLAIFIQGE